MEWTKEQGSRMKGLVEAAKLQSNEFEFHTYPNNIAKSYKQMEACLTNETSKLYEIGLTANII